MWNLKIPPKIKNLMWRAATGCLPTKVQLRSKHVNVCHLCPMCNSEPETICHALLYCSFSKECRTRIGVTILNDTHSSFLEWLSGSFDNWEVEQRQLGAMLCWALWKYRNELVWNQRSSEVVEVV